MRRLLFLALLAASAIAQQQQERPPDMPLTPEVRTQIIEAAADRIERHYVDPVKAKEIAAALRAAAKSGPVAEAKTALELVPPVNRILQAMGDRHLRFGYSHEPDTRDPDAPETAEEKVARRREAESDGYGIHGIERREGNIGVLTWARFHDPDVAGDAVAAAMQLLHATDALIIDLRNSAGGSPEMVTLLLTYFLPEGDPVLLSTIENRYKGMTQQFWSLPYVPGPRYTGKPVYVVTSKRTWSAGEGLTEHLRRLRGAIVVGETTRGGARMSRWINVHPNFAVSVSVARHIGDVVDWEGVGIKPDVAVTEGEALEEAYRLARP